MARFDPARRRLLTGSAAALSLGGCDRLADGATRDVMAGANTLTYRMQRLLIGNASMAREYTEADIRQPMRPNGSRDPETQEYRALAEGGFADYRFEVAGLVDQPLSLSLEELRALPVRTQITRHDCVEGWSCIAKWTGVPLAEVLDRAVVRPEARYVVFGCYDMLSGAQYYESIDMVDARHPQTILAYDMNDDRLPIANGAPLRVRIERQIGYKMAKYLRGIELSDSLDGYQGGMGGYWEDRGYDWFAGI